MWSGKETEILMSEIKKIGVKSIVHLHVIICIFVISLL
jgi:hypothetical protein